MNDFIQLFCTTPDKKTAKKISCLLLNNKLASCVQISGPIISNYWWNNKIEKTKEWLCFIKTRSNLFTQVEESIKNIHPYKVPEIISFEISNGNKDYYNWINDSVKNN